MKHTPETYPTSGNTLCKESLSLIFIYRCTADKFT